MPIAARSKPTARPISHHFEPPEPPKTPKSQRTRARLLDAAGRLFIERGYAAVSMQDISTAAGLTKGALYGHFRSKAQLLVTVIQTKLAAYTAEVDAAASESGPDIEALFGAGARVVRLLEIDAAAAARHDPEVADALRQMYEQRFASLRDRFAERPNPETTAWLVNIIFAGMAVHEAAAITAVDHTQLEDMLRLMTATRSRA